MKTKFYKLAFMMAALLSSQVITSQTPLKMGASGGPAGNGPASTAQAVTLYENGSTAFSPAVTVTYTFSNQQFGAGTLEGIASKPAMNFGGNLNNSSNSSISAQAYYSQMNAVSSPLNSMFSGCSSCGAAGINVATDKSISLFNCTEAFINASTGANTQALNARIYIGELTLSFNRPVSNPVLQLVGLGGTTTISRSNKTYDLGFSTEFDLNSSSVTLSKLAGNNYLDVTNNKITNSATWFGSSSQGSSSNGITRYAASGSVLVSGTNITSVSLKVYIHGDGGRVSKNSSVIAPDAGFNPLWAFGNTNVFYTDGTVSGDLLLMGVSALKPVTVSGNVFNDADGGFVNNSTGTTNAVPAGIYAHLIDGTGKMVSEVAVNTNGTYSFPAVFAGTYTVNISIVTGTQGITAPQASVPYGWLATGEYNGAPNSGNDGNVNSTSSSFTVTTTDIANINFGIERPPLAPTQTYAITQPAFNSTITLNGAATNASPGPLKVVDPEEGNLSAGKPFSITTDAGMNGNKLYYDGVEIKGTVMIASYNPALLTLKFSGSGSIEMQFSFQGYDAAGKVSNSTLYHMIWLKVLPVSLFEAAATVNGTAVNLSWKTENETNTSLFYAERSTDNINFVTIGTVTAAGNSAAAKNYNVKDDISAVAANVIYYRIKLVDNNGKITCSNTAVIRVAGLNSVNVWPNPFTERISLSFNSSSNTMAVVRLTDMEGHILQQTENKISKGNNQVTIGNLSTVPGGMYLVQVTDKANNFHFVQKVKK